MYLWRKTPKTPPLVHGRNRKTPPDSAPEKNKNTRKNKNRTRSEENNTTGTEKKNEYGQDHCHPQKRVPNMNTTTTKTEHKEKRTTENKEQ
jgi:hypothetical protein